MHSDKREQNETNEKKMLQQVFLINTQHTNPTADTTENENIHCVFWAQKLSLWLEHICDVTRLNIDGFLLLYFFRLCIGTVNRILRIFRSDWLAFRVSISRGSDSLVCAQHRMPMRQGSQHHKPFRMCVYGYFIYS